MLVGCTRLLAVLLIFVSFLLESSQGVTCDFQGVACFAPTYVSSSIQENIRGVTVAPIEDSRLGDVGYGSDRCRLALKEIVELGGSWISITPFGRMDDLDSTEVQHDFEIPVQINEDMIRKTALDAKTLGLKVAVIPHVYVMSGQWRGRIDPGGDARFEQWFLSYERYLVRFAILAEEIGADLFSIGVEFASSTNYYGHRWRQTIARVRSVYSGALTYSANWDEYEYVEFWDDLDLIGINAFWPLASKPGDGYEEMLGTAGAIAQELEAFAFYWDRPILFTEFGIKSSTDSALAPWEWPEDCSNLVYDEVYQEMAYQAVFEVMTQNDWFEGLFIWKYFSDPYDETQEKRTGFSPHFKSAERVLSDWYFRPWNESWGHIV